MIDTNYSERIQRAKNFARIAHEGQVRKFSGLPYFDEHVIKVYELVVRYGSTEDEQIAALLHDTVEDVEGITYDQIKDEFGEEPADLVEELTSDDEKIAEMGKANYLLFKMLNMTDSALKIKLCDRLCNISDLMTAKEKFRAKYYKETRFIVDGIYERELTETHKTILQDIESILDEVNFYYKYENKTNLKHLKMFEDFKQNNITLDDIIKCIDKGGIIYANIVKDFPDNDPEIPLNPVSVDNDGVVTVEIDGNNYEVDLKRIDRIEY